MIAAGLLSPTKHTNLAGRGSPATATAAARADAGPVPPHKRVVNPVSSQKSLRACWLRSSRHGGAVHLHAPVSARENDDTRKCSLAREQIGVSDGRRLLLTGKKPHVSRQVNCAVHDLDIPGASSWASFGPACHHEKGFVMPTVVTGSRLRL